MLLSRFLMILYFKKAFYKEPSLLNLLISASEGKDVEGTGILPAINLVNKYNLGKVKRILVKINIFKVNKEHHLSLLNQSV